MSQTIPEWWASRPIGLRRTMTTILVLHVALLVFTVAIRAFVIASIDAGAFLVARFVVHLKVRQV